MQSRFVCHEILESMAREAAAVIAEAQPVAREGSDSAE
jgi:hypothetical protein